MAAKHVILVRHGESCAQLFSMSQRRNANGDAALADQLRDPYLSELGVQQALDLSGRWAYEGVSPALVVASPLSRALQTAQILFPFTEAGAPVIVVHPALRETPPGGANKVGRATQPECMGRPVEDLQRDTQLQRQGVRSSSNVDWSLMPDATLGPWWSELVETPEDVEARLNIFCSWLEQRPESLVVVVCHFNIIQCLLALRRLKVQNCSPIACHVEGRKWQCLEPAESLEEHAARGVKGDGLEAQEA
ncbi:unnamed protein product, partial [Polarella glacialis]